MGHPWRDADKLRELHFERGLTAPEMAEELGCSKTTLFEWIHKHEIDYDRNRGKPWNNEELLRDLYINQGLSLSEVADQLGCSSSTIQHFLDKFDIDTRTPPDVEYKDAPWRDPDLLRELYHERGLSTVQIGEKFSCASKTIREWMVKHGIERREYVDAIKKTYRWRPASFQSTQRGYERWSTNVDGTHRVVYVHRLLAVAEYGFEAVKDKDVHHKNEIKWDNRPENIELTTKEDHTALHAENPDTPWRDAGRMREELQTHSQAELAEKWDCSSGVISRWAGIHGLRDD